jgi:hypothetical protein
MRLAGCVEPFSKEKLSLCSQQVARGILIPAGRWRHAAHAQSNESFIIDGPLQDLNGLAMLVILPEESSILNSRRFVAKSIRMENSTERLLKRPSLPRQLRTRQPQSREILVLESLWLVKSNPVNMMTIKNWMISMFTSTVP